MEKYKFLPDVATADIAFEAYGKTANELFAHAAEATFAQMVDFATVEATEQREVEVTGATIEEALYNLLEELVFMKDVEVMVFSQFDVNVVLANPVRVHAVVKGEEINQKKHKLGNDVKAITMHMFAVKKSAEGFVARVVLDI